MQAYVGGALECMCVGEKAPCRPQFSPSWVLGKAIRLAATAFTCSVTFVILRLGLNVQLGLALNADPALNVSPQSAEITCVYYHVHLSKSV